LILDAPRTSQKTDNCTGQLPKKIIDFSMKEKQFRTKSIVQLEFYSCLLRNKKVLHKDVSLPRIHQRSRWPQKEREETFETQKALPKGLPRDKISMASEKKPGFCKRPQRAERTS
jgi:hypothetical protein